MKETKIWQKTTFNVNYKEKFNITHKKKGQMTIEIELRLKMWIVISQFT